MTYKQYLMSSRSIKICRDNYNIVDIIKFIKNNAKITVRPSSNPPKIYLIQNGELNQTVINNNANKRLVVLVSVVSISSINGKVNISKEKRQKIDGFIDSLLFSCERHSFAGANLAIVYQGEIVYTTGYGVRNLGQTFIFTKLFSLTPIWIIEMISFEMTEHMSGE